MKLSLILPVLDEADAIAATLTSLQPLRAGLLARVAYAAGRGA